MQAAGLGGCRICPNLGLFSLYKDSDRGNIKTVLLDLFCSLAV